MNTSDKISAERLDEIKKTPVQFDDDIPEFTEEDLKDFYPAHPECFKIKPVKKSICIKIDEDILEALKAQGKGYQTRINDILRSVVFSEQPCVRTNN